MPQFFLLLTFHRIIEAISSIYMLIPSLWISFYVANLHIFGMFGEDVFHIFQPSLLFFVLFHVGYSQSFHLKRQASDHMRYDA